MVIKKKNVHSVVMMGASGAVGGYALQTLIKSSEIERVTLLGRRTISKIKNDKVEQHIISISDQYTYAHLLSGHDTAICTLGVGEPSKVSKDEFIKIDKIAVLDFAKACKTAGIDHFELLSSVGIDSKSSSYYLRIKGELVDELEALQFQRLSIFKPSMILTPTNRYGILQAITLFVWPMLNPVLIGRLRKLRGINVEHLGKAIAQNVFIQGSSREDYFWDDFKKLSA